MSGSTAVQPDIPSANDPPKGVPPAPVTSVGRSRRRPRAGSSLTAHGEPMVWLIGGGLAVCALMIVVLIGWIALQGFATFWPKPIVQLETTDGTMLLGEVTRSELFEPRIPPAADGDGVEADVVDAGAAVEEDALLGLATRRLIRIGNREYTGTPFRWVPSAAVETEMTPEWAVLAERLEWGPFIGVPTGFRIDGEPVADDAAAAWAAFGEHHDDVVRRQTQRKQLERDDTGEVNYVLEHDRLAVRRAELDVQHAEHSHGRESEAYRQAHARFEQARATHAQTQRWAQAEFNRIRALIDELNAENARYEIVMRTADEREVAIPLGEIVRAYPANQLGFFDKVSVYGSRWWEFLTDDPREANTEGGVFPPIIGTVVMTLLMCFVVVPFGVLAALYLREYARPGPIVSAVRIAVNNLAGVPSIVFGVFGLGFFCYIVGGYIDRGPTDPTTMGPWMGALAVLIAIALVAAATTVVKLRAADQRAFGARLLGYAAVALWLLALGVCAWMFIRVPFFDGFFAARAADGSPTFGKGGVLWASLTLALLTLPVVIVATEEALAAVPSSMREGSYACGASKWQTVRRIVLPRAMPGIMTGMILAMARGAGEVAPLMLVGAVAMAPELPVDGHFPFVHMERSFMHLGFHIYDVGFQSPDSEGARPMVYTTTLLLIAIIATLNLAAFYLRTRLRRRFAESQF
ncbi:MAG: ABC transporter permease subunit [Phycisphaeraceae bacterium]